jgi:ferredoxin-NADP reductase
MNAMNPEISPAPFDARLKSITWEAPGVLSLCFTSLDGSLLPPFEPGAHVDLHLPDGTIRPYSLCGDPADSSQYRIGVREIDGGRATAAIHRALRPGMALRLGRPRNAFPFVEADRYLFVAGGIGVTPLLPMMRAARAAGATWSLLFCARAREEAPFLAEALALGGEVTLHASRAGTRLDVAARLAEAPPGTLLYCCGPESLMLAVADATKHWPEGTVRFEWFAAKARPEGETSGAFEVFCARSGVTVSVPPENSILGVLLERGIEVPRSCEQGVCGTCEVHVLEGRVDHRDSILSAEEQAANETMMTCVSRCLGPRLVLDI